MPAGAFVFVLKLHCPKEGCEFYLSEFTTVEWNAQNPVPSPARRVSLCLSEENRKYAIRYRLNQKSVYQPCRLYLLDHPDNADCYRHGSRRKVRRGGPASCAATDRTLASGFGRSSEADGHFENACPCKECLSDPLDHDAF
jgi:hypothetical protein